MEKLTKKIYWFDFFLAFLFLIPFTKCDEWLEPSSSRYKLVNELKKQTSDLIAFHGNRSYTDNFKLLLENDTYIIVGGRNILYHLSLPYLKEIEEEVSMVELEL